MTARPFTTQLDIYDAIQAAPRFDGADITDDDTPRLTGQLERIWRYLLDGQWHTLREISEACQAPEASVSAQCRNLRKPRFGGHNIKRRHLGGGLYEYRLVQVTP